MSTPVRSAEPLSVLIIDDDAVLRITMQDYLEEVGFEVREAENGRSGLAAFAQLPADIVLLDVMMPGMDGFTVCVKLRATPAGEHVPILMVTGNDDAESVQRAFQAGATDFTTKPLNYDLLVHRVHYLLRAKQTADRLRQREKDLEYAQRIARLGNWELDLKTNGFRCSEALTDILGFVATDHPTQYADLLAAIHVDDRPHVEQTLSRSLVNGNSYHLEFRVVRPDNTEIVVYQNSEVQTDPSGTARMLLGGIQDITERRAAEVRIRELAYYDNVTGLPNRALLQEHLNHAIEVARRNGHSMAVLFVDLDHFKRINDTWGHTVGDELLRRVAERLTECIRQCDFLTRHVLPGSAAPSQSNTIARLGGDEFVVLLTELRHPGDAATVAERITTMLSKPISLQQTDVCITGSIGISTFPADGEDAETMLKQADGAMYDAKSAGRNGYQFYEAGTQARAFERLSMESSLRRALQQEQFILHYQPKVELGSGRTVGMEALVRWENPAIGIVSPADFIPIAEETGLIVPLGEWVLNTACAQARAWRDQGLDFLRVSVNLSAAQFRQSNLTAMVIDALAQHRLQPETLELELTESLLMNDAEAHTRLLHELRDIGVQLSIDDFGTGYSSLSYLKRFPINTLKIDSSFIRDLETDEDDAAIVKGAISLAHSLRLIVVAEGVETQAQNDLLREFECDQIQGYYYSRPLPAADFSAWVRKRESRLILKAVS